jgi:hypothetical protein
MFNTLRNKMKPMTCIKQKDRFNLVKPQCKLICDLRSSSENLLTPLNISEMYIYEELIIILSEDGTIYLVDILASISNKYIYKTIKSFSHPNKLAKSISLNLANGSLLIVYLMRDSYLAELKCAKITLQNLKEYLEGSVEINGVEIEDIFKSENLSSPAFVEFDEFNNKIITRNSLSTYKVWNMKDFKLVFEMTDKRIDEIRTADGIFLTIRSQDTHDKLLLSVYEIGTGKLVINYEINLIPMVELEILEIFDKVLLLKQAGSNSLIVNLITFEYNIIKNDFLDEKSLFMFINKSNSFVTLNRNTLIFYSIKGEELRRIKNDNIDMIYPNHVHLTCDRNYLLVYWEERKEKSRCNMNNMMNNFNNTMNTNLKTPKSKNVTAKSSKILYTESNYALPEFEYTGEVKNNCDTILSKFVDSNDSEISEVKNSQNPDILSSEFFFSQSIIVKSHKDYDNNGSKHSKEIFKGEFELISLSEKLGETKLIINSDNINIPCKITEMIAFLKSEPKDELEKVSYSIFNTKTMRIYIMMQSGKIFECGI